jgi:predicted ester cyclase
MSTEDNKAIVRRAYLDGLNKHDLSVVDEVFDPHYVVHYLHTDPIEGIGKAKEFLTQFLTAFPDCVFTVEDQVAEGDKVVLRWRCVGTHLGEWRGLPGSTDPTIPASGKPIDFTATDIYLIRDGKIVEEWNTLEPLDVMNQIGAVPGV